MNDSFVENVDVPIIGITNDNRKLNIDDIDFDNY